jgi:hypothetical protein
MQSPEEAIKVLENYISFAFCKEGAQAWSTLKAVVLAQQQTTRPAVKLLKKVECVRACSLGKHSDSEWQKGFDIGLSAMYDFIKQLQA